MEFGFCWAPYLWKISLRLSSDVCSCGFFSDLLYGFMAFRGKPKVFQQSWQDEDLEIFESIFPGRPSWLQPFRAGTCLRAQVTRKLIGNLGLETVLGCKVCWDIVNGKFGHFWFSYKFKLQLKWKIKLSKISELMHISSNCRAVCSSEKRRSREKKKKQSLVFDEPLLQPPLSNILELTVMTGGTGRL